MPFLMTDDGLINLAHVETAQRISIKGREQYRLKNAEGGYIGTVNANQMDQAIEAIVAPSEPYECLQIWFDGDEHWVSAADVIAWALGVTGWVYPVSADDISPKTENYALRRRGEERIELPMDATFDNEAAWVAEEIKRRQRERELRAARKE